ncbi:VOC family protein [Sinanaerobacter chloroacetimidivorans]|nr:VOC family protein [Sinanaerobacter chloroacetimidivorans]
MMFLDHVAIYTYDIEKLKDFYTKYFSGKENRKYYNEKTGLQTYFITFEGGARLEIMSKPNLALTDQSFPAIGMAHISFRTGSREKVDRLTKALIEDGYFLKSGPRETGDGYYESCVLDPDSNEVEIMA